MTSDILSGLAPEPRWLSAVKFAGQLAADALALVLIAIAAPACVLLLAAIMGSL